MNYFTLIILNYYKRKWQVINRDFTNKRLIIKASTSWLGAGDVYY